MFSSKKSYKPVFRVWIAALFFILSCSARFYGQELPACQMYLLNPALVNPAIIGCKDCSEINLLDRHQWIGSFKGAPKTQVLTAETSIKNDFRTHGLGLQVVNDANGAYRELAAGIGYAFHVTLSRSNNLKLGLGLMATVYQSTYDERDFTRMNDPIITWGIEREIKPDVYTGVYLYNDKFFTGLSAVQLLAGQSDLAAYRDARGYFAYGGYNLEVSRLLSLQPGVMVKYLVEQIQSDINARITYRESYWAILSYRHIWRDFPGKPGNLMIYAGLNYNHFTFGFGYDLGLGSIQRFGYGSYEFKVGYRICPLRKLCPAYQ